MAHETRYGRAAAAKVAGLGIAAALAVGISAPVRAWASDEAGTDGASEVAVEAAVPEEEPVAADAAVIEAAPDAGETTVVEAPAAPVPQAVGDTQDDVQDDAQGSTVATEPTARVEAEAETEAQPADAEDAAASASPEEPAAEVPQDEVQAIATDDAQTGTTVAADVVAAQPEAPATTTTASPDLAAASSTPASSTTATAQAQEDDQHLTNIYRLYNKWTGEHLYTRNLQEALSIARVGWQWEGPAFTGSTTTGSAIYRLYNRYSGLHHYTTDAAERDTLSSIGWSYEGVDWYATGDSGLIRLYNRYDGNHLYTASESEATFLASIGWTLESRSAWRTNSSTLPLEHGEWLVTSAWGSQERYWIAKDGQIAKGRYIEKSEGSGWRAYAKADGAVVRGVYATSGSEGLLADDKGELESAEGMLVTGKYTSGTLQRYYLRNGHVQLGEFTVDGKRYFGRYDTGYVVRGNYFYSGTGVLYRGDNDGVLQQRTTRTDSYLDWALAIAKDDSHGYSQINRWGPNYDCSSLVISALRHAGFQTGGATYTGNMYSQLRRYGWYSVAPGLQNAQYGDILLNDANHTALYLGNGWVVQASSDENHSWQGYTSGDQTGKEIWYRTYYDYPWNRILRHA